MEALATRPVVLLNGARQTGKTTLVQGVAVKEHPARYLTFDDSGVLAAASADPAGFIAGLDGPVILDEIQRVPDLFPALKLAVDRDRQPGRFLLTGSVNVMLLPKLSESLAGRMEILTLWPLSQGEIDGSAETFVDVLWEGKLPSTKAKAEALPRIVRRIVRGGYPELSQGKVAGRSGTWFGSYLTTILQRDVRELAHIDGLTEMPRLLAILAARAGNLQNYADISRMSGMPQSSVKRYMALLETTYLVQHLSAWFRNIGKRLAKAPKVLLTDTGLLCHLLGADEQRLLSDTNLLGSILENFVVMEFRKQLSWSRTSAQLFHLRTHLQEEVDVVMEAPNGDVVGIEVKASASVGGGDFKGLRILAGQLGKQFRCGVLLYTGSEVIPFGENLHAVPLSSVWAG